MSSGIYRIRNVINNKSYYGSSKDIEKRWCQHQSNLNCERHINPHLQRAWKKYGADNFVFEIVELVEVDLLLDVEQQYLDENVGGYNIAPAGGGDTTSKHPDREAIIAKRVESVINRNAKLCPEEYARIYCGKIGEKNGMYGKTHTEDVIRKIKEKLHSWYSENDGYRKGKTFEEVHGAEIAEHLKRKLSEFASTRTGAKNPFYGKHHSDEAKQKIREKHLGKPLSQSAKLAITGENSAKFQGYYHTPWGVFPSTPQAQKAHPYLLSNTINTWCKKCDVVISRTGRSRYLQEIGESVVGKTYREIGFWFEEKGA
jgi:group I intron endonuclease